MLRALRGAFCRAGPSNASNAAVGAHCACGAAGSGRTNRCWACAGFQLARDALLGPGSTRGIIVEVHNDGDIAMRTLDNKMRKERVYDEAKARKFYTKPCQARREYFKSARHRAEKKKMSAMLAFVMVRRQKEVDQAKNPAASAER